MSKRAYEQLVEFFAELADADLSEQLEADLCTCRCHKTGGMHIIACCSYCPHCHGPIANWRYSAHLQRCPKRPLVSETTEE